MNEEKKITADEFIESLTGFEEIAIAKAFGDEVFNLAQNKETMFVRALVFVHFKREGSNDPEAKKQALSMTLKAAQSMFADEDDTAVQMESGEGETPAA
ncbi:hypothetical protein [Nocardioides sp. Soil796]|uniref:hypothetical protein n=1 Tax=Nocardioides sp. Soil796 TaxID=1736412 RepID=UPI00070923BC|nr:hypothetical protein [Nocardioides sp. Soil796]KRF19663.1 hypothetical protein ASH02_24215 [Nocardioides sp. Soil796]